MVKRKTLIELVIEQRAFPNKGIGTWEGQKVVVKNALPGQKVLAKTSKQKNGTIEASLVEVVEQAENEKLAGCSHFEHCGGCAYQTLTHEDELKLKETQVLTLLRQGGIDTTCFEGIENAPNVKGYRNKCEFSFGDEQKDGPLALGMRKRNSFYEVVTLKDCNIIDEDFNKILNGALKFFQDHHASFYHKLRHEGFLRHFVVRKGARTGEILLNIVTSSQGTFSEDDFVKAMLDLPLDGKICGMIHTINDSVADVVKKDQMHILFGRDYYFDQLCGLEFQISAFSFFQTNTIGAEKLYGIIKEFAGETKDKILFDLYCGTGTIAQIMAKESKQVFGIEIVEEAIEAAKENAKRNGIDGCVFLAGDVLQKIDELEQKPDLIILDPPREGIHPKAIGKIIHFQAPEIIYVSCKPTSLVRDLQVFLDNGYKIERMKCLDQFSRTVHIESVVLLSRVNKQ